MPAAKVGFLAAFPMFFKRYVDFTGRSSRSEYWWWQVWSTLIAIFLFGGIALAAVQSFGNHSYALPLLVMAVIAVLAYGLGILVPRIALTVRRFRDAGVNPLVLIGTWGAPYLVGQWVSMSHLSEVAEWVDDFGNTVNVSVGDVKLLILSAVITVICGVINFVVTVLPGTTKSRFFMPQD